MASGLWRSLVFWSGLLVMGFIVWAWWDSTRQVSFLRSERWELQNWASGVSVARVSLGPALARGWESGRKDLPQGERTVLALVKSLVITSKSGSLHEAWADQGVPSLVERPEPVSGYYDPRLVEVRLARAGFIAMAENDDSFADFLRTVHGPALDMALQDDARRILTDIYLQPKSRRRGDGWVLFIPHWMLLLATALGWGGMLLWRARRMKRHERLLATIGSEV